MKRNNGRVAPEITVRLNPSVRISFFYLFYMLVTAFYYVTVEYGRSKPLPYLQWADLLIEFQFVEQNNPDRRQIYRG